MKLISDDIKDEVVRYYTIHPELGSRAIGKLFGVSGSSVRRWVNIRGVAHKRKNDPVDWVFLDELLEDYTHQEIIDIYREKTGENVCAQSLRSRKKMLGIPTVRKRTFYSIAGPIGKLMDAWKRPKELPKRYRRKVM